MSKNASGSVLAIAGNPNSGKTTLFNALTGSHQRVGNWPGVTVERKSGSASLGGTAVELVDLPGIYSLSSHSEDERVARDYLLSGEATAVVNIVDAANLERNLFLTMNLIEMRVPLVLVLNMADLAEKRGLSADADSLSKSLGVPVFAMNATKAGDVASFREWLASRLPSLWPSPIDVSYPAPVERAIGLLSPKVGALADELGTDARWVSLKLLERDSFLTGKLVRLGAVSEGEIDEAVAAIEGEGCDSPDAEIAAAKYERIAPVVAAARAARTGASGGASGPSARTKADSDPSRSLAGDRIDRVVLNRALGIPIFLVVMYAMFWIVINVGGAFIDFFDILFGAVFVDGLGNLLSSAGAPEWLVAFLAGGVGAGIQTVATFVPIMFAMFFMLSLLEDSGYMARAAFVMDRALRAIGLPGKAFIPMIVGFGCTVPAIMATRTLENRRDRFITVFMAPFMSCGARLPVYALFGAAFFGARADLVVMSLYLVGIALSVLTGFMLKNTMFRGEPAPFVMELPPYHVPKFSSLMRHVGVRLGSFVGRAGKVIVIVVAVLGILNSVGTDGSFGNEDTEESVLSALGKGVTPVFKPMGLTEENWPATVGMFTGLFAKEAVVGTLNGLYGQLASGSSPSDEPEDAGAEVAGDSGETDEAWSFGNEVAAAFASIPEAFAGLGGTILDPVGASIITDDEEAVAESVEADRGVFGAMRSYFNGDAHAAYAYLLFILVYFPCLAALGAIIREIGPLFGWIAIGYLTVLAWITATLYYQIAAAREAVWIALPLALLACVVAAFSLLRKKALATV